MDDLKDLIWANTPYKNTKSNSNTNNSINSNQNQINNQNNNNNNSFQFNNFSYYSKPNQNNSQINTNNSFNSNLNTFNRGNNNNNAFLNTSTISTNNGNKYNSLNNNLRGSGSIGNGSYSSISANNSFANNTSFNYNNNNNIANNSSFNYNNNSNISSNSSINSNDKKTNNDIFGNFSSFSSFNNNNGALNQNSTGNNNQYKSSTSSINSNTNDNFLKLNSSFSNTNNSFISNDKKNNNTSQKSDPFASLGSLIMPNTNTMNKNINSNSNNISMNSLKKQQEIQNQNVTAKKNDPWNFDIFEKKTNSNLDSSINKSTLSSNSRNNILLEFDFLTQDNKSVNQSISKDSSNNNSSSRSSISNSNTNININIGNSNNNSNVNNYGGNINSNINTGKNNRDTKTNNINDIFNFSAESNSQSKSNNGRSIKNPIPIQNSNRLKTDLFSDDASSYNSSDDRMESALCEHLVKNTHISSPIEPKSGYFKDRNIAQLIDMGFTESNARFAINATDNNLEDAIQLLLNMQNSNDKNSENTNSATTNYNSLNIENATSSNGSSPKSKILAAGFNMYNKATEIFKDTFSNLQFNDNQQSSSSTNNNNSITGNDNTFTKPTISSTTAVPSNSTDKNKDLNESKKRTSGNIFTVDYFYKEDDLNENIDDIILPNPEDFTRYKRVDEVSIKSSSSNSNSPKTKGLSSPLGNSINQQQEIGKSTMSTTTTTSNNTKTNSSDTAAANTTSTTQTKPKRKIKNDATSNSSGSNNSSVIFNDPDDFVRYRHLEEEISPSSMGDDEKEESIDSLMEVFATKKCDNFVNDNNSNNSSPKANMSPFGETINANQQLYGNFNTQQNQNSNQFTEVNLMSNVYASNKQIQKAKAYKEKGNDYFKKGQFAEAEIQYSNAIRELPDGHTDLIALYNNRAITWIKTGHYKECISDCTYVQSLNSNDIKSLTRRATAYEHMEKWDMALSDYQKIQKIDSNVTLAIQGINRCKKAIEIHNNASKESSNKMDDIFGSSNSNNNSSSKNMNKIKALNSTISKKINTDVINAQQEAIKNLKMKEEKTKAEEYEKFQLKDYVDEKILKWSAGKENNIRALVSSLDMVLWPELNWKNLTLGDLLSPQKLKIGYMKAIAKVHPDKIKSDESVEHKIIANSVFGILNNAWDTFKEQNGIS